MLKPRFRQVAAIALLGLFLFTGCYGKFALVKKMYSWNGAVENKYAKSAVLWGLAIIPVYVFATLADALVFNVIEFWSDRNPITAKRDVSIKSAHVMGWDVEQTILHRNGVTEVTLRNYKGGRFINTVYIRQKDGSDTLVAQIEWANSQKDKLILKRTPTGEVLITHVNHLGILGSRLASLQEVQSVKSRLQDLAANWEVRAGFQ